MRKSTYFFAVLAAGVLLWRPSGVSANDLESVSAGARPQFGEVSGVGDASGTDSPSAVDGSGGGAKADVKLSFTDPVKDLRRQVPARAGGDVLADAKSTAKYSLIGGVVGGVGGGFFGGLPGALLGAVAGVLVGAWWGHSAAGSSKSSKGVVESRTDKLNDAINGKFE